MSRNKLITNYNGKGNYGNEEVTIEKGERIAQGIFKQFLVADNGNTDKERIGGMGSTGEK